MSRDILKTTLLLIEQLDSSLPEKLGNKIRNLSKIITQISKKQKDSQELESISEAVLKEYRKFLELPEESSREDILDSAQRQLQAIVDDKSNEKIVGKIIDKLNLVIRAFNGVNEHALNPDDAKIDAEQYNINERKDGETIASYIMRIQAQVKVVKNKQQLLDDLYLKVKLFENLRDALAKKPQPAVKKKAANRSQLIEATLESKEKVTALNNVLETNYTEHNAKVVALQGQAKDELNKLNPHKPAKDKIIVYVWYLKGVVPGSRKMFGMDSTGHIGISVGEEYLSFYPNKSGSAKPSFLAKLAKKLGMPSPDACQGVFRPLEEDLYRRYVSTDNYSYWQCEAIEIPCGDKKLDIDAATKYAKELLSDPVKYAFFSKNCSSIGFNILKKAGAEDVMPLPTSHGVLPDSPGECRNYARDVKQRIEEAALQERLVVAAPYQQRIRKRLAHIKAQLQKDLEALIRNHEPYNNDPLYTQDNKTEAQNLLKEAKKKIEDIDRDIENAKDVARINEILAGKKYEQAIQYVTRPRNSEEFKDKFIVEHISPLFSTLKIFLPSENEQAIDSILGILKANCKEPIETVNQAIPQKNYSLLQLIQQQDNTIVLLIAAAGEKKDGFLTKNPRQFSLEVVKKLDQTAKDFGYELYERVQSCDNIYFHALHQLANNLNRPDLVRDFYTNNKDRKKTYAILYDTLNKLQNDDNDIKSLIDTVLSNYIDEACCNSLQTFEKTYVDQVQMATGIFNGYLYFDAHASYEEEDNNNIMARLRLILGVNQAGCDLHLMSKLPADHSPYKGSYIFIKENDTRELHYIKPNGQAEQVPINNFDLFEQQINHIKKEGELKLHLSEQQIKEIVKSNGGYTHQIKNIKDLMDSSINNFKKNPAETKYDNASQAIYNILANLKRNDHAKAPISYIEAKKQIEEEISKAANWALPATKKELKKLKLQAFVVAAHQGFVNGHLNKDEFIFELREVAKLEDDLAKKQTLERYIDSFASQAYLDDISPEEKQKFTDVKSFNFYNDLTEELISSDDPLEFIHQLPIDMNDQERIKQSSWQILDDVIRNICKHPLFTTEMNPYGIKHWDYYFSNAMREGFGENTKDFANKKLNKVYKEIEEKKEETLTDSEKLFMDVYHHLKVATTFLNESMSASTRQNKIQSLQDESRIQQGDYFYNKIKELTFHVRAAGRVRNLAQESVLHQVSSLSMGFQGEFFKLVDEEVEVKDIKEAEKKPRQLLAQITIAKHFDQLAQEENNEFSENELDTLKQHIKPADLANNDRLILEKLIVDKYLKNPRCVEARYVEKLCQDREDIKAVVEIYKVRMFLMKTEAKLYNSITWYEDVVSLRQNLKTQYELIKETNLPEAEVNDSKLEVDEVEEKDNAGSFITKDEYKKLKDVALVKLNQSIGTLNKLVFLEDEKIKKLIAKFLDVSDSNTKTIEKILSEATHSAVEEARKYNYSPEEHYKMQLVELICAFSAGNIDEVKFYHKLSSYIEDHSRPKSWGPLNWLYDLTERHDRGHKYSQMSKLKEMRKEFLNKFASLEAQRLDSVVSLNGAIKIQPKGYVQETGSSSLINDSQAKKEKKPVDFLTEIETTKRNEQNSTKKLKTKISDKLNSFFRKGQHERKMDAAQKVKLNVKYEHYNTRKAELEGVNNDEQNDMEKVERGQAVIEIFKT
ncbi:Uncharacterised protein [Legionella busanensis]|uniref:Uncharacterized protein n=1 Tax=Legionella busanensis TaxID=190655 RepID=A0A378JJ08_9GAMM|nr:hypothetical protein [Legionella busanensis]STX50741.1 Uncharacterised protein [Legionella busanensis]